DTLLEWLCLHLEETELPTGFDPRGRMLDVVRPGQGQGKGQEGGGGAGQAGQMTDEGVGGED
ncbi:unnamed protein product, partial [Discosporangium mesarthrocarpum]